jgi:hypothetical protein
MGSNTKNRNKLKHQLPEIHPCCTPTLVSNASPTAFPDLTAHVVLSYIERKISTSFTGNPHAANIS